jgi:hypothetical protein
LIEDGKKEKIDMPRNTTCFRTGIDLPVMLFQTLECAGLAISQDVKEKLLKT